MKKRATLADVAREAGLSMQTVSHVLSGNPTVRLPETTRERVRRAAEVVGYVPNRLAQAMKSGRTQMISVWMPIDRPNINLLEMLRAINTVLRRDSYDMMMVGLDSGQAYGLNHRMPYQWPVDGIISNDAGRALKVFREDKSNDRIPICVLGFEQFANSDAVAWDLAGAARKVTERLIAQGRKRIAHVSLDWILRDFPVEQRRRGHAEAMEAAGRMQLLVPVSGETSSAAEASFEEWLNANEPPDAVFCVTDTVAMGVARALMKRGISIPGDCVVWGHGGFPEVEDFSVPIHTMRLDRDAVAEQAWTWLRERMDSPSLDARLHVFDMELVERE